MLFGLWALLAITALLLSISEKETKAQTVRPIEPTNAPKVIASEPVTPQLSRPVRELPTNQNKLFLDREINPLRNPGLFQDDLGLTGTDTHKQDPLAAQSVNNGRTPGLSFDFEGLGSDGYAPPDTVGDVGPNHYIQMVNVSFAIFDKSGNIVQGDTLFTDLFAGSGLTACETENDGDPIVVYDDLADRWLLSQFAISTGNRMCIAISTTPDPTGAYYLYQFTMPNFPDYFKFGVWPDAYYMGTNTGFPNQYYAYAFDRARMLNGLPATFQYSNGHANFLMPADLDGANAPPGGTPGYFYTMYSNGYPNHPAGVDRLALYEFDVDWATPANSTFALAQEHPIAPYNYTVCGFFVGNCIPQPGTAQGLDSLSYWPMFRFAYRNLIGYEAMVGNFTVDLDGTNKAAIRWFEMQRTGTNPWTLHQEGTYAPDSDHRWMGSIALDGSGHIALGYSVSSGTTIPAIRYATRLRTDPLGTLQAEQSLIEGGGVQTGINRWGDYSAMSVDPADDCTFWYTSEYHDINNAGFNWNTRVGVFRIPECTGSLGPDFTLDATPASQTVCAPDTAVYDLSLDYLAGFNRQVALSAVGVPAGTTASMVPATVMTPTTSSTLTLTVGATTPGSYDIDIVGVAVPTPTHTTTVSLDVYDAVPGTPVLTAPANGANGVPLSPALSWTAVPQAASYIIQIDDDPGFGSVDYTAVTTDTSHTVGTPLAAGTTYYWRIQASNGCGSSPYSPPRIFTTLVVVCSIYPSTNVPLRIPPTGTAGTTSSVLNIPTNGTIIDVNVLNLVGTHTWMGDLDFFLERPGTSVQLYENVAACSANNFNVNFDDEAAPGVPPCPPIGGFTYQPFSQLSAFDGQGQAGTWTLRIVDNFFGDFGFLNSWSLEICTGSTAGGTAIWDGGGTTNNWSEGTNWVGDTVPQATDTVLFDTTSTKNALLDAAFPGTVSNAIINTGYTGTITMDRPFTVIGNYTQLDGVFVVSDPATAVMTVGGNMNHISGVLRQTQTVNGTAVPFLQIEDGAAAIKYRGATLDATPYSSNLGAVTVNVRAVDRVTQFCTNTGAMSGPYAGRCFDVTPTITGTAMLRLYALTSELPGSPFSPAVYHDTTGAGDWVQLTTNAATGTIGTYTYAEAEATGFSPFLIGDAVETPTAVTLTNLTTARQPFLPIAWLLLGMLILTSLSLWFRHKTSRP
jgi:subtilisin-like proprotein convertase family protein